MSIRKRVESGRIPDVQKSRPFKKKKKASRGGRLSTAQRGTSLSIRCGGKGKDINHGKKNAKNRGLWWFPGGQEFRR